MNDPKRYRLDPESYLAEHPQGDFIDYQDYARIKAENARLKTEVEHLMVFCNCTLIPNKELQAKVERLTKAGDLLAFHYISLGRKFFPDDPLPSSIKDWNAAKEGKQP
jgi:hypothetical protein